MVYRYDNTDCYMLPSYPVGSYITEWYSVAKMYAAYMVRFLNVTPDTYGLRLIGRGSSGAILCSFVSIILNKEYDVHSEVIHIKKEGEMSHTDVSSYLKNDYRNIIIDDFVVSGNTIQNILDYKEEIYYEALFVYGEVYEDLIRHWENRIKNFFIKHDTQ